MSCNNQDTFTKEANYLLGFQFILFNLLGQSCLSLAQVLFLQIMILIRRILQLLILLVILIILTTLRLTYGQNSSIVMILLINNWPTFLVILLIYSILIKSLVLILIQRKLKLAFLIHLAVLSLTSSIISCSNIIFISMQTLCNLI